MCGLNSKRVCALEYNGEYEYEIINNGKEVEITGYIGTETEIEIPEVIDGLPVTSIGNQAFFKKAITKLNPSTKQLLRASSAIYSTDAGIETVDSLKAE